MAGGSGDKTEKATPKKRDEARKKGQVARSADLNGAVVLLASLLALSAFGPKMVETAANAMRESFAAIQLGSDLTGKTLMQTLGHELLQTLVAVMPVALVCMVAGVLISIVQVRWRPSAEAIKPDPKKLNPVSGAKNIFGMNALFETGKTILKVSVIAAITATALIPRFSDLAGMMGSSPITVATELVRLILAIAQRAGIAYLFIAAIDYAYQFHRTEKQLKMDKQEVKEEAKGQSLPSEVKAQQRRRAMQAAQQRMMSAVPQADVVVTNPTHFAVALKYGPGMEAPEVIAKGQDLLAFRIRELAKDAGVPVVEDPPLARSLHKHVEIGRQIPEELFQAVAALLAYVYRMAARRTA